MQSRVTCTANQAVLNPYLSPGRSRGTHESIVELRDAPRKKWLGWQLMHIIELKLLHNCARSRAVPEGACLAAENPGK